MADTPLIYRDSLPVGHWVDFHAPLSLSLKADLTFRGWVVDQLDPGFRVFCRSHTAASLLHELVVQLAHDEHMRSAIPPNTFVASQMFNGVLDDK